MSKASATAEKSIGVMTGGGAGSMSKVAADWTRAQSHVDPVFAAQTRQQQAVEKAYRASAAAVSLGVTTVDQAAKVVQATSDRYGALVTKAQQAAESQTTFGKATSGISGQLVGMAAGFGPIGIALSGMGPLGLAAAAGLGAVGAAMSYVESESERMGQKAIEVRKFTDVTGLAVDQISALKRVGASFGVDGDSLQSSFSRLTAGLDDAHRASGALFDDVQRVSGGLAIQLKDSNTTAEGINALAKAYAAAGDSASKAALARAAFGKGGASSGPVLDAIASAGGIENLSNKTKELNDATTAQTKRWAEMQAQIDISTKSAKNILASIFTEDGLNKALQAALLMERVARAAKDAAEKRQGLSFLQNLAVTAASTSDTAQTEAGARVLEEVTDKFAALQRVAKGIGSNLAVDKTAIDSWTQLADAFRNILTPAQEVEKSLTKLRNDAAADAKIAGSKVGQLGSAAPRKRPASPLKEAA
jgi:hypothetical protein